MKEKISVKVNSRFEGYHCWPDAPEAVAFLRDVHRHIFHISVTMQVSHTDRDIEFILFKQWLEEGPIRILQSSLVAQHASTMSCEEICLYLGHAIEDMYGEHPMTIEVSEDGENSGILEWSV